MKQQLDTQEGCLTYFEKLRWGKTVICPYCSSEKTHASKNEQGRHFCYSCIKSFSVMVGTIFEDTRLQLPLWIGIIKAMLKNDSNISVKKLSEEFSITPKTAWLTSMKIRCAMIDPNTELQGLLSMDINEVNNTTTSKKLGKYFVSKNKNAASPLQVRKLNSGTRLKDIELQPVNLIGLLKHYIKYDENEPTLTTRSYNVMDKTIAQITKKYDEKNGTQKKKSLKDNYWSFIKNGIRDDSKSLSAKYLPFYLLEYEYKFKRRNSTAHLFTEFMKSVFAPQQEVVYEKQAKAKKHVARA